MEAQPANHGEWQSRASRASTHERSGGGRNQRAAALKSPKTSPASQRISFGSTQLALEQFSLFRARACRSDRHAARAAGGIGIAIDQATASETRQTVSPEAAISDRTPALQALRTRIAETRNWGLFS